MSNKQKPIESHDYAIMLKRVMRNMELSSGVATMTGKEDLRLLFGAIRELRDELQTCRNSLKQYTNDTWRADEVLEKYDDAEYAVEHYGGNL